MRRNIPLIARLGLSILVFILAFAGAFGLAALFMMLVETRSHYDALVATLMMVGWLVLAWFPAMQMYTFLTHKHLAGAQHCEGCGYLLTGNTSGVCPECGRSVSLEEQIRREVIADYETRLAEAAAMKRWTRRAIALLLLAAVVGAFSWATQLTKSTLPDDMELAGGNWRFLSWQPGTPGRDLEPNTIYAEFNGRTIARFQLASPGTLPVLSANVYDAQAHPWFQIDLARRGFTVDNYTSAGQPDSSLADTDGDLIPDRKKDWQTGAWQCTDRVPQWVDCPNKNATSQPTDE